MAGATKMEGTITITDGEEILTIIMDGEIKEETKEETREEIRVDFKVVVYGNSHLMAFSGLLRCKNIKEVLNHFNLVILKNLLKAKSF